MKNDYNFLGRLNKIYNSDKIYIDASGNFWFNKFDEVIKKFLVNKNIVNNHDFDLTDLHDHVNDDFMITDTLGDGTSRLGKMFYDNDDQEYFDVYHEFLYWLRYKIIKQDFYFQKTPTIRVWFKNQKTITRYHTDMDLGHPPQEINLWWAFTKNKNTGFVIADELSDCESWYKNYDFDRKLFWEKTNSSDDEFNEVGKSITTPAISNVIYLFDSRLIHSAVDRSDDDSTRVSIDIRINPVKDYRDGYRGLGRMSADFKPGGLYGYHEKSIDKLRSDL